MPEVVVKDPLISSGEIFNEGWKVSRSTIVDWLNLFIAHKPPMQQAI